MVLYPFQTHQLVHSLLEFDDWELGLFSLLKSLTSIKKSRQALWIAMQQLSCHNDLFVYVMLFVW